MSAFAAEGDMKTQAGVSSGYKWWLLAFLFVTYFLEQASRQIYNAALPQIKADFAVFGVTNTQLGVVGTVFGAVFGVSLVGSGLAADFIGRKRTLVAGTLMFSLGVLVSGFAQGLFLMVAFYGVLNAVGQCCVAPPSYSLISQYHDNTTRSTAMSIFQSAVYAGVIISSTAAGKLASMGEGGWRNAFWIFGGIGIVWALVMQIFMRDTPQSAAVADGAEKEATVKDGLLELLRKPTAILIALAFGMFIYGSFGLRNWMTLFMREEFADKGLAVVSFHSVFWMFLGALLGCVGTARLVDRFGRGRPRIRLDVSVAGFLLMVAPMIWVGSSRGFVECCAALFVLGLAIGVYEAAHYPAMFDCIAPRYRSVTTGLTGCMAFLIGSLSPVVIGWMSERMSMRAGLMSLGGFFLAGALILLPAQIWLFKKDWLGNEKA
jgi:sugar phosphate permease